MNCLEPTEVLIRDEQAKMGWVKVGANKTFEIILLYVDKITKRG